MPAYYSEFDKNAAAWLRELIKRGLIADGEVDERDLWDVTPNDIRGFTQVHLCAGIGVWSYALRRAGWPDDRPVWTASFPCQPFSAAGARGGFADERHLWPAGQHLISECRPDVVLGEQVSSKDGLVWFDLVSTDLERAGYAVGAADTCSAGVGAPHIRQRLYWVADAKLPAQPRQRPVGGAVVRDEDAAGLAGNGVVVRLDRDTGDARMLQGHGTSADRGLGHPERLGAGRDTGTGAGAQGGHGGGHVGDDARPSGAVVGLADGARDRRGEERPDAGGQPVGDRAEGLATGLGAGGSDSRPGPTNGLWRDADWLFCRDGKWRPVEPGTFPLAHGAPARVGRLRGYGNAVNAEAAVAWIESYLEARADLAAA